MTYTERTPTERHTEYIQHKHHVQKHSVTLLTVCVFLLCLNASGKKIYIYWDAEAASTMTELSYIMQTLVRKDCPKRTDAHTNMDT